MKPLSKLHPLHGVLYLVIIVIAMLQLWYINHTPWSPIDEYQHMDYIDNVATGNLPSISDSISEELVMEILQHPERNSSHAESRAALGLTAYSYQAKHPPLYYMILAVPDYLMRQLAYPVFERMQILRMISFLLFITGLLLMLRIGSTMRQMGYDVPKTYILLGIAWCLFTATHERFGVGNNFLSPLLINASLLALFTYIQSPGPRRMLLLSILCGLSVCGALTNLFVLPIIAIMALPAFIRTFNAGQAMAFLGGLILPASMLVYWKLNSIPDPLVGETITAILRHFIRANMVDYTTFLKLLLLDVVQIDFLGHTMDLSMFHIFLAMINGILMITFFNYRKKNNTTWIFYAYLSFIYFIVLIGLLNRYVDEVTWVAFRHYLGFYPFLYMGFTSGFLLAATWIAEKKTIFFKPKNSY